MGWHAVRGDSRYVCMQIIDEQTVDNRKEDIVAVQAEKPQNLAEDGKTGRLSIGGYADA